MSAFLLLTERDEPIALGAVLPNQHAQAVRICGAVARFPLDLIVRHRMIR